MKLIWLIPELMIVPLQKYLYLRDVRRLQFYGIGLLIDFQPPSLYVAYFLSNMFILSPTH